MQDNFSIIHEIDPVALYAALVATIVLVWDVIKWMGERQAVSLNVIVPAETMTETNGLESGPLAALSVSNIGNKPTTITHIVIQYYSNWIRVVANRPNKTMWVPTPNARLPIPHELNIGRQWIGAVNYDENLKQMADNGYVYFEVYYTSGKKPVRARIKERAEFLRQHRKQQ
jgi:hypothetical protein